MDACDPCGVCEVDWELVTFLVGSKLTEASLVDFEDRIKRLPSGKILIKKFVRFQYGKLSKDCKPHNPVFAAIDRHGLSVDEFYQNETYDNGCPSNVRERIIDRDGLTCVYTGRSLSFSEVRIDHVRPKSNGGSNDDDNLVVTSHHMNQTKGCLGLLEFCKRAKLDFDDVCKRLSKATGKPIEAFDKGLEWVQDKTGYGKGQDKDKKRNGQEGGVRGWEPDDVQKLLNSLFHRKDSTKWSDKEVRAYNHLKPIPNEDLRLVHAYYTAEWPKGEDYRRRDLQTLLNNWNGEVDRARQHTESPLFAGKPEMRRNCATGEWEPVP